MSTVTGIEIQHAVEDAAAHLYVWALKDIPQDLRDALAAAKDRETSVTGQRVLQTIHRNINIADEEKNLVCQAPASRSTPAASASISRSTRRGSTRRSATAPPARPSSTRSGRTPSTR